MATIHTITLPNGSTYEIEDSTARSAISNINSFSVSVVQTLPTTNIDTHTIYFVSNSGSSGNIYDEYIYVNNNWEKIGTTDIDLSGYLSKTNTTAYTPIGDYNPATKKYVDDKSLMVVTITYAGVNQSGNNIYTADKTFAQITSHISEGGEVYCRNYSDGEYTFYYLKYSSSNLIQFEHIITSGSTELNLYKLIIDSDNSIEEVSVYPTSDLFVVTITSTTTEGITTYSADKTFAEIMAAYYTGMLCICIQNGYIYQLSELFSNQLTFSLVFNSSSDAETIYARSIFIDDSNVVTFNAGTAFTYKGVRNVYPYKEQIAKVNATNYTLANLNKGIVTYNTTTATQAYSAGDLFWLNYNVLAKATTDIASGATLTENTNYVKTTIADELKNSSQVEPEDDIVVLNLLSEFNFTTPITDADGDLIEDADNYIFLG